MTEIRWVKESCNEFSEFCISVKMVIPYVEILLPNDLKPNQTKQTNKQKARSGVHRGKPRWQFLRQTKHKLLVSQAHFDNMVEMFKMFYISSKKLEDFSEHCLKMLCKAVVSCAFWEILKLYVSFCLEFSLYSKLLLRILIIRLSRLILCIIYFVQYKSTAEAKTVKK